MEQLSHFLFFWVKRLGMPLVAIYHALCGSVFLNTEIENGQGLEYAANQVLAPVHYLLVGKKAVYDTEAQTYRIEQRFSYDEHFGVRTLASLAALPASITVGSGLKALALMSSKARERYTNVVFAMEHPEIKSNVDNYRKLGLAAGHALEKLRSPVYDRGLERSEDFTLYTKALKDIDSVFRKNEIPYWLDCGTLLGAYRYRGFIPWDEDLDIAILQPDFDNARIALSQLNPNVYQVFDWSSRDKEKTYLMVHIKGTAHLIDIYHFAIEPEQKTLRGIVSNIDCMFLPHSWKVREGRFARSIPYDQVFPLKKTTFEGIEVFVPNDTVTYLQGVYGKDLRPAKIFDPKTKRFEKDLTHPYWQKEFVH